MAGLLCTGFLPVAGIADLTPTVIPGLAWSAEQAQAQWMPERRNWRWRQTPETLFFFEFQCGQEYTDSSLLLYVNLPDQKLSLPMGSLSVGANYREYWLPFVPGEAIHFSLLKEGRVVSELKKTFPAFNDVWWHFDVTGVRQLDPLAHGYALLPKNKVLVTRGDPLEWTVSMGGLGPRHQSVTLQVSIEKSGMTIAQSEASISSVEFLTRSEWKAQFTTGGLFPGRYIVKAVLMNSEDKSIGEHAKELILIEPQKTRRRFGAVYTDLKYDGPVLIDEKDALGEKQLTKGTRSWEELSPHFGPLQDIVVGFEDQPYKMVFWRGASYVPMWEIDQVWSCWEWVETAGSRVPGYRGPVEPLMDREVRFGRVRVIASHPARVIVHWRYPQSTRVYTIVEDEWVDEYYYLYPDMVGTRKIMGWFPQGSWHEINEFITVIPAGMHPREALAFPVTMTISDMQGRDLDLVYPEPWKNWDSRWSQFSRDKDDFVFRTHLKDRPSAFVGIADLKRVYSTVWSGAFRARYPEAKNAYAAAGTSERTTEQFVGAREIPWLGCWSWPVQRVPAIGSIVCEPWQYQDVPTHWCLFDIEHEPVVKRDLGNGRKSEVWVNLLGLDIDVDPVAMTRSWIKPAEVRARNGLTYQDYDLTQRAYRFHATNLSAPLDLVLLHRGESPLVHPVLVVDGILSRDKVRLHWKGQELSPDQFKYGYEAQPDGDVRLVLWVNKTIKDRETHVEITFPEIESE